jgi:hypothetical protein
MNLWVCIMENVFVPWYALKPVVDLTGQLDLANEAQNKVGSQITNNKRYIINHK